MTSKIYNYPDVIKALPDNLQEKQHFPTVTSYQLESSISNNILIYKDALHSAEAEEVVLFSLLTTYTTVEIQDFATHIRSI